MQRVKQMIQLVNKGKVPTYTSEKKKQRSKLSVQIGALGRSYEEQEKLQKKFLNELNKDRKSQLKFIDELIEYVKLI